MTRRSRRRAEAERRGRATAARPGEDQYYIHMLDEWGTDRPLSVIRVRADGGEEKIGPGAVWVPGKGALKQAGRTQGYSAVPVDVDTGERAAARWAYEFQRIVDRESGRTVAFIRTWLPPSLGLFRLEESTCRSGIWESTHRLRRIDWGQDDYAVETVEASTVEEHLRDLQPPEHRYFAVVQDGSTKSGLRDPLEVLRVRTGQETGARERLGAGWEPYDIIDGVEGLRKLTLLEIDEDTVARFRERPAAEEPQWTYFALLHAGSESVEKAETVVRQRRVGTEVYEEVLRAGPRWTVSNYAGIGTRESDQESVEISAEMVEKLKAPFRYTYYEILLPDGGKPMAVVRHWDALRGSEEAAVGWPVWDSSQWIKQIAEGKVPYRAREADPEAVVRFLRQAAADLPQFRYFAFLDTGESIDSPSQMARMHLRKDGEPDQEETPRRDGSWVTTFSMLEINHGRGSWWLEPVEVPRWMFDRYRAERLETR